MLREAGILLCLLNLLALWHVWFNLNTHEVPQRNDAKPKYNTSWKPAQDRINIHLVPHTHDDAGWQVSVDEYSLSQVDTILDNVMLQLEEDENRRFTFAETNFFVSWYRRQSSARQKRMKALILGNRMEFVNGGWVQHDEACLLFGDMIDQTTRGHHWLAREFDGLVPTVGWQLDPFGHSNTQAWLLSAKAGFSSLFFGRSDYRELAQRYKNATLQYIWQGRQLAQGEPMSHVLTSQLFGDGNLGNYGTKYEFEFTDATRRNYVQDDEEMQDYNLDLWVERIVEWARKQNRSMPGNHQLWMLGTDFTYQSASRWFSNYDKLIHYLNKDGRVRMFYSTPSHFAKELVAQHQRSPFEMRQGVDLFPLADGPRQYWTGYFTSRPTLKRQYRYSSQFLQFARQIEAFHFYRNQGHHYAPQPAMKRRATSKVGRFARIHTS